MSAVNHPEIAAFATDKVNLPHDTAVKYRSQVQGLRDRLEAKIKVDPSFDLVKMLHSGSVAKGTALRNVNDLDVAVYVKAGRPHQPRSIPAITMTTHPQRWHHALNAFTIAFPRQIEITTH